MTTLHMDVEIVRNAQSNMKNTHQQLSSMVQNMTNIIHGLQGAWQGNSANEFFSQFDQWRSSTNQKLDELQQLAQKLQQEINEWEQMASKF